MQTADSRLCSDLAAAVLSKFDQAGARRLLIQSDMSSVVVIIANIFEAEPYQMSLFQRDDVIQHLTAYAPNPSFRDSVGQGSQLHIIVTLRIHVSKSSILFIHCEVRNSDWGSTATTGARTESTSTMLKGAGPRFQQGGRQ